MKLFRDILKHNGHIISLILTLSLSLPYANAQQAESNENTNQEQQDVNQVKFITDDQFMLTGKYYAGKENHSAVLLLHGCDYHSGSYTGLAEQLSSLGLHALAIDLRGYGDSVSDNFSHAYIKRNTKDINIYKTEVARLMSYWQNDILTAYKYLRSRIDKKRDVAVVSSGCTASQAIYLAQKMRINGFVMITPILNYMEKEQYKNLIDIPVYFAGSAHHTETFQTIKELFEWNGDSRSIFQLFKGIRQGHTLLNGKRFLAQNIALWLDDTLSKQTKP